MERAPAEPPQLRPLGVGDIVDRVFTMYRQHALLFIGLAAIPDLISVLISQGGRLLFPDAFLQFDPFSLRDENAVSRALERVSVENARGDISVALLTLLPQSFAIAALTWAASHVYLGRVVTPRAAAVAALDHVPRVLGTLVVAFLVAAVIWGALFAASIVPLFLTGIGLFTLLVLVCVFVVPFFLVASLVIAPTVSVLEIAGPLRSVRRALSLVAGHRWRVLAVLVLLLVLQMVIAFLVTGLIVGAFATESTVGQVAGLLASVLVSIVWEPLPWATLAVLYYDLRVRKEAFDLQLAAEALPREA